MYIYICYIIIYITYRQQYDAADIPNKFNLSKD